MPSSSRNVVLVTLMVIGTVAGGVNAKPPSQIRGGHEASPGEYNWVVGIIANGDPLTLCGGAIISPRHILTAGHCVFNRPNTFSVRSGNINANSTDVLVTRVSRYILHPAYKNRIPGVQKLKNDIAILVLEEDLPLDERRSVISLPSKQVQSQLASFAGWGDMSSNPLIQPTTLQTAHVMVVEDAECVSPLRPQFICGYQQNGHNLDGDSGSPLVTGGEVIGISSGTYNLARVPDCYTNVYHYNIWIKSVLASF